MPKTLAEVTRDAKQLSPKQRMKRISILLAKRRDEAAEKASPPYQPGGPRRLLPPASRRSGLARLTHPARRARVRYGTHRVGCRTWP